MTEAPVRKHNGDIQVPTDLYRDENGRTVILYGMMHVGDSKFYDDAFDQLVRYRADGYEVHYEKIEKGDDTPPAISMDMRKVAEIMGAEYQLDAMPLPANWKRTDMTMQEFLSHSSKEDVDALVARMKKINRAVNYLSKSRLGRALVSGTFRFVMGLFSNADLIDAANKAADKPNDPMRHSIVIDMRNEIALAAIDGTDKDVVAVWGAAHLSGIGEGLVKRGFKRIARNWNTVLPAKGSR